LQEQNLLNDQPDILVKVKARPNVSLAGTVYKEMKSVIDVLKDISALQLLKSRSSEEKENIL